MVDVCLVATFYREEIIENSVGFRHFLISHTVKTGEGRVRICLCHFVDIFEFLPYGILLSAFCRNSQQDYMGNY